MAGVGNAGIAITASPNQPNCLIVIIEHQGARIARRDERAVGSPNHDVVLALLAAGSFHRSSHVHHAAQGDAAGAADLTYAGGATAQDIERVHAGHAANRGNGIRAMRDVLRGRRDQQSRTRAVHKVVIAGFAVVSKRMVLLRALVHYLGNGVESIGADQAGLTLPGKHGSIN